jgi:ribosomal protein L20A (L18A)
MKKLLLTSIIMMTSICPIQGQNFEIRYYKVTKIPQKELDKGKLLSLLNRGIEIMASEECEEDRKKIIGFESEELAEAFVDFNPMSGSDAKFIATDGMYKLLQKTRKAAGLLPGPGIGFAPSLLGKVVLNSVRLTDETIMLLVDKARRDDKMYDSGLYIIAEPTELKERPLLNLNRKELISLLRRGIEIMASEEYKEDRNKIVEITDEDDYDALEYIMYYSEFASRNDIRELTQKIQYLENFNADITAARLLLANVVLNSMRLQESTMLLIAYHVRLKDRIWFASRIVVPPSINYEFE